MPKYKLPLLIPSTLAGLPSPVGLLTGTAFEITDYGGNIATVVNGVYRFEYPFRTTWANRPPVALVSSGTELQATDYEYQKWICNGTVWRPAQGRVVLKDQFGFLAAGGQIAQLSGATSGLFAVPGGCKIQTGMIIPHSRLCVQADAYKVGANGQGLFSLLLGTTNSLADSTFVGMTVGSATGVNLLATGAARFGSASDKFSTRMWQGEGTSSASNNSMVDKTTSVNTNADMWVNIAISGVSALDTFNLVALQIVLEA